MAFDAALLLRMPSSDSFVPPAGGAAPAARLAVVVLAATLLGLGGWVVWDAVGDEEVRADRETLPPLPEPAEPRTQAMVATGTGFGWTWVNPQPRGMPTWYAVDAAPGGARVVMVGRAGAAVRYADGGLYGWSTGTEHDLRGVAWVAEHRAIAAGERATLLELRAEDSAPLEVPRSVVDAGITLRAVAALGEDRAIVVGDGGTVLRVDGRRVEVLDVGTDADLLAAFRRGERVFLAGTEGTLLVVDEDGITTEAVGVSATLRAIGGCPSGSLYAGGDGGLLLRRRPSGQWSRVSTPGTATTTGVSCDHGRVAVVTAEGRVLLVSGDRTVELPTGFDRAWHGVDGGTEGASWLVGVGGRLATIEDDHLRIRTAGPTVPIRALGGMGGALVAVGEWGRILRQRERGIVQADSPTEAGLAALIPMDEGRLLAVGDFGAMVDIRFDRAVLLDTPVEASLRDGVSEGDELLVVGAGGTVLRGVVGALSASVVPGVGDLWSVAGRPSDALAVGDAGIVLRFSSSGFSRVPCPGAVTLRAVERTREGAWAVGDGGRIIHLTEGGCTLEHDGGPTLHAVGVGPDGRPLAAGDDGTLLRREEGGAWSAAGVDVGRASLRTIWRDGRYVYVAGTGGVLVRHIVVDGS